MKERFWRKALAAVLALSLVTGYVPIQPLSQVFEDIVITASAESLSEYDLTYGASISGTIKVDADINVDRPIYLLDDTYLYLESGCTLTIGSAGTIIGQGHNLVIDGEGSINGGPGFSGITKVNNLVIESGTIKWESSLGSTISATNVTINGGDIRLSSPHYSGIKADTINLNGGSIYVDKYDAPLIYINELEVQASLINGETLRLGNKTITWKNYDGSTLKTDTVEYGKTPSYSGTTPAKASDEKYSYTFSGWSPAVSAVTSDTTYTAQYTKAPITAHFSQDDENTYTIHDETGWEIFCDCLQDNDTYNRFIGKTVNLDADISVTEIAGGSGHDFMGTFDGQGHTLTVSYGSADSPIDEDKVAPFRNVEEGCVIEDLHTAGTIYSSKKYAGGIVGTQYGSVIIRNCRSSVTINSSTSGDGTHGGLVGTNGSAPTSEIKIEGCVFDGKILTAGKDDTTSCSGFVGWKNAKVTITNSIYAPAAPESGETEVSSGATFIRNGSAGTNCYYTRPLGDAQGKQAHTITADEDITIGYGTAANTYDVSGITAYDTGLVYNGDFYAGEDDEVALTLGNTSPEGHTFNGYTVNAGTLTGSDDTFTLTMPNDDVIVKEGFDDTSILKLGENTKTIPMSGRDFTFTPTASGMYTFYSTGNYDVWAHLYDSEERINYDIDNVDIRITTYLKADVTYRLRVGSDETQDIKLPLIVDNDIEIKELELGETIASPIGSSSTLAYWFRPIVSGTYVFYSANDSGYGDPYAYLYKGDTQIAWDHDGGEGDNFRLAVELTANETYLLKVGANARTVIDLPLYVESKTDITELSIGENTVRVPNYNGVYPYAFTPTESGRYVFYTAGDNIDTFADLYQGSELKIHDEDSGDGNNFKIVADLMGGKTYFLKLYSRENAELNTSLFVDESVRHSITTETSEKGTVRADPSSAYSGETVRLVIFPASGYYVSRVLVNGSDAQRNIDEYWFTMPDENVTVSVEFTPSPDPVSVTYLDENEEIQSVEAIPLTGNETILENGWYVVNEDVAYTNTIKLSGDVKLILADGRTMTVTTTGSDIYGVGIEGSNGNFTIYGQSEGTGTLDINTETKGNAIDIFCGFLKIHGGIINAKADSDISGYTGINVSGETYSSGLIITGGKVNVNSKRGHGIKIEGVNSEITGGQVTVTADGYGIMISDNRYDKDEDDNWIYYPGSLTLGYSKATDFFSYNSICSDCYEYSIYENGIHIVPGQVLTDGNKEYREKIDIKDLAPYKPVIFSPKTYTVAVTSRTVSDEMSVAEITVSDEIQIYGKSVTAAAPDMQDEGYSFVGWFPAYATEFSDTPLSADLVYTFDVTSDTSLAAVYENNGTTEVKPFLAGHSLSLDGSIAVKYMYELPSDAQNNDTYVEFTVDGKKQTVNFDSVDTYYDEDRNKTYYVFKCPLYAYQMNIPINAVIHACGNEYTAEEYTARQNAISIITGRYPDTAKALAKAMLNYGAEAQKYFGYNIDKLANYQYEDDTISEITADDIFGWEEEVRYSDTDTSENSIRFEGATLTLNSETTLSFYFTSENELTFETNSNYGIESTTVILSGVRYQVARIRGFRAEKLGNSVTVNATDGSTSCSVTYNPINYMKKAIENEMDEKAVCQAMYKYWEKARNYPDSIQGS